MTWYKYDKNEVLELLNSDMKEGLKESEVRLRSEKYGANELKEEARKGILSRILDQFSDILVIILIVAAIVSIFLGEQRDAMVIMAIVVINAALGIYQEGQAEKALDSLKEMTSPHSQVYRQGRLVTIPTKDLVPGDIVVLETGDIIPADLRLIESYNLKIEEAALTGESIAVDKEADIKYEKDIPIGDRENMAYMSTNVSYGRGLGIVVETGDKTEIGKISQTIQSIEEELTPLQKNLNELGKYLGITTVAICIIVFVMGWIQGKDTLEMLMVAISLAVAAIPEGLPAIVTIVLALAMNKMVKRQAIVKKLLAVETLGSTTVICSDKTGTLTQNEMTIVKVFTGNNLIDVTGTGYNPVGSFQMDNKDIDIGRMEDLDILLSIGLLNNDASLEIDNNSYKVRGDATEGALLTLAKKGKKNKNDLDENYPRIGEIPFDSKRKMMTTFHKDFFQGYISSLTKGAPDIVLNRCNKILIDGKEMVLDNRMKKRIVNINNYLARNALRVLAIAYRNNDKLPDKKFLKESEKNMTFVGLVGMIDPARPETKDSIEKCKEAGILPVMITGDYRETAFAIAKELKIAKDLNQTITGEEIDKLSQEELRDKVKEKTVYARVSPDHKVKIVSALKENGEVVAMTGDGVNDAMALKKSDIGVAMGITGTDVAKNTAEIVLTDDNFASIVSAIEEGRIIYSNIKKFIFFLLSCNIGEILLVFASIFMNLPVPLLPIQLLWLNLVTDSFPALALGIEEGDPSIMKDRPRDPKKSIIDKAMGIAIVIESISIAFVSLFSYIWALNTFPGNLQLSRTIVFATLITAELVRAYSSRSERYILLEIGIFSNRSMVYATLLSFILLLAVLYIPFMQVIFHTVPLDLTEWGIVLTFALFPLLIGELYKVIVYRKDRKKSKV